MAKEVNAALVCSLPSQRSCAYFFLDLVGLAAFATGLASDFGAGFFLFFPKTASQPSDTFLLSDIPTRTRLIDHSLYVWPIETGFPQPDRLEPTRPIRLLCEPGRYRPARKRRRESPLRQSYWHRSRMARPIAKPSDRLHHPQSLPADRPTGNSIR